VHAFRTASWPGPTRKQSRQFKWAALGLTFFENAAAERGWARPDPGTGFQAEIDEGSLYLGSVENGRDQGSPWVIQLLGLSLFDLAYATGRVPHEQKMATIELYGREVIPRVRELLAEPAYERDTRQPGPVRTAML